MRLRRAPQQAEQSFVPLADRVAAAEQRLCDQRSDALFEALSDAEIDAKIAAGRHLRELNLAQEVREGEAEVAARDTELRRLRTLRERDEAEEDRRRTEEASIRRWKQRADDKAEQLTSNAA